MASSKKKQKASAPKTARKGGSGNGNNSFSSMSKLWGSLLVGLVAIASVVLAVKSQSQQQQSVNNEGPQFAGGKVLDQATAAVQAAALEPYNVAKAQDAAQAYFLEGSMKNASKWFRFTLRRQAIVVGGTPAQAMATSRYELLHFLQHLEVNVILLTKVLLQGGVPFAQQVEHQCEHPASVSRALQQDPTTLTRSVVAALVVQCVLHDDLLLELQEKAYVKLNAGWNPWLFLAHFGNAALLKNGFQHLSVRHLEQDAKDPFGRSAVEIARYRGFEEAAQLLSSFKGESDQDKPSQPDTSGPFTETFIQEDSNKDVGGWSKQPKNQQSSPKEFACHIPVIQADHAFSQKEFYENYMAKETPVIVRQGANKAVFSQLQQLLAKKSFYENFGLMPIHVGAVPYLDVQGTTVQQYLDQQFDKKSHNTGPNYLFESLPTGHPLRQAVESHYPDWAGPSHPEERQVQVAIGPQGSGAPPHYHKAAVNTLFYGLKKWYFIPPSESLTTTKSMKEWLAEDYHGWAKGKKQMYECVQQPGDVVFVPDFWTHATHNIEPSVAVASEFVTPRMDFDMVL